MVKALSGTDDGRGRPRVERLTSSAVVALAAAILFGLSAPVAKLLLRDSTPQLLAGLLYLGSGAGLSMAWLARRRGDHEAPLSRADAPWLAVAIGSGGVVAPVLLLVGLTTAAASVASLLLNLEGVFTALLAWFVFRENFDRRIALGMVAIVAGGVSLSWAGRVESGGLGGPMAVVGACLCWALDNNVTQKISAGDPVQIAMLKGLVAGAVNLLIALVLGAEWPGPARVGTALALGVLSYGASLVLYVMALRQLGTARTGAYFSVAPFVGALASIALFHEAITPTLVIAGSLMALGVWLHLTERHEHEHTHHALEHAHAHVHDEHHHHAHAADDPAITDPVPHVHRHRHEPLIHTHPHYPDIHHRHEHD